jgi:hypothetical protein
MPLQKSADKLREAAESEATADERHDDGERAQRQSDSAAAEVQPEILSHRHSKAKPPRR